MSKEIVKRTKEVRDLATIDYGEDEGGGYEGQTTEEIQIPFLALLQALSPQVTEGDMKAGQLFNTVTEESYGDSVLFVPSRREIAFVEWVPRDKGGGFVGRHEIGSEVVIAAKAAAGTRFRKLKHPDNGNDLMETIYLYGVLILDEGSRLEPVCVAFSSTKISEYRKYNTKVSMFTILREDGSKIKPPRWGYLFKVGVRSQKNAKGTFFNFDFVPAEGSVKASLLRPEDPRYLAGKDLADMVSSGMAKAVEEAPEGEAVTPEGEEVF
jgi:hypothetical protein